MKTCYINLYTFIQPKRNHNTGHLFFSHSGDPKISKYLKISILGSASNMVITYRRWLFFHRLQWRLLTTAKQGEGHHSINPIGLHPTHKTVKDSDMQLLCPINLWIEQFTPTGKVPGISPIEVLISTTHRESTSTQDPNGSDWSIHSDDRTHLCILLLSPNYYLSWFVVSFMSNHLLCQQRQQAWPPLHPAK